MLVHILLFTLILLFFLQFFSQIHHQHHLRHHLHSIMTRICGIGLAANTPRAWPAHQEWWTDEEAEDPAAITTTDSWDTEATTTAETETPLTWGVLGGTVAGSETGPDPDEGINWRFWGVAGALGVCLLSLLGVFIRRIR